MTTKKIICVKLSNSVKCHTKEETYFHTDHYDITREETFLIKIKHRASGDEIYSSIMNAISWKEEGEPKEVKKPSKKD
jgi:hypothetical protein